jgi:thiol-disulfide isomerase/thioredoxin
MAERRLRFPTSLAARSALAAAAAALAAGLYVSLAGSGNGDAGRLACAEASSAAHRLDALASGEVAAFQPAEIPQKLSGMAFLGSDGKATTLAAFSGKVALVNLWATWCAPCRREMPALDRLQSTMGGADFTVVPISIDTGDTDRPRAFLESVGVKHLPLYTDPSTAIFGELKKRSLALGLPVTVLLDRNGCELGHMNGPAEWDSAEGRKLIEAAIGGKASPSG